MASHRIPLSRNVAVLVAVALFACGKRSLAEHPTPMVAEALAVPGSAPAARLAVPAAQGAAPVATFSLAPLVESVKAAVVNVEVQSRVRMPSVPEEFGSDPFERFFGFRFPGGPQGRRMPPQVRQGNGSGFIIRSDGLVLTNNHVVDGADTIRVRLDDGRSFDGEILGKDPLTDLALLRLKGRLDHLPVVTLGDSDAMRVGDWVVAIGNPFGLASSVSAGIISARARTIGAGPYDDFLQTDAAINPGNSGGPLFNLDGQVIGINTAIIGGGTGIGFAVPSNIAKALLPQLEKGVVSRGWLGVGIQDLTPDLSKALNVPVEHGAVVADVNEDTPAQRAGLKADDVVVAVDGQAIDSAKALSLAVGLRQPGAQVSLTVYRDGKRQDLRVKLGERPDLEGVRTKPARSQQRDRTHEKLGLTFQDASERTGTRGALITQIEPGSAADRAELRPGMVIVEAGGKPVHDARDLARAIQDAPSGAALLLRVQVNDTRQLRALPLP